MVMCMVLADMFTESIKTPQYEALIRTLIRD